MANLLPGTHPCINPECGSSDGLRHYDNGTGFCFVCKNFFTKAQMEESEGESFSSEKTETQPKKSYSPNAPKPWYQRITTDEISTFRSRGFAERQVKKVIAEFFGVKVSYDSDGDIHRHYYPYDGGNAYKVRTLPKDFVWVGKSTGLFGKDKFSGAGKRVVITEGEIDAMSVAQCYMDKHGKIYPVVAMSSSVMTKSLLEHRDWLRSFQEIILMLDMDEPGEKATAEALKILGADKCRIAKLPEKDPNEVYLKHGSEALLHCIWNAEAYIPPGIVGKDELWERMVNYNQATSVPYPPCLEGVNTKLKGKRLGEITLFISGTGSGKSTILREDMLFTLENIPETEKIGVVSLEEDPAETARKLAGMQILKNPAEEEVPIDELKVGFDKVFGSDRVILLDHQGSMNDTRIIDQLEYMALSGAKYLYVDHITILVSEGVENLTGNEAQDKVMNDLLRLVKRYNVWIGLVSHLRKAPGNGKTFEEGKLPSIDDIRGSGSIKQISFDIISFARNLTATVEDERNTIKMRILKSRYTGLTGTVDGARYIRETGRLVASDAHADDFTEL